MTGGSGPTKDSELELTLPPKPEYVRTVRHTVGALARLHGVPEDVVEDIKLAVSEACTTAVPTESESAVAGPITIRVWGEQERVVLEVLDRKPAPAKEILGVPQALDTGDLPFEKALALPLIQGLVNEVAMGPSEDGEGTVLRMTVSYDPGV